MGAELPEFEQISDYLAFHAKRLPGTIALSCDEFALTYDELVNEIERYAAALATAGIGPDDVVGVLGYSRPECLITFLACCRVGAVFLGLNPKHTERELSYVLQDSRPRLVAGLHAAADAEQDQKLKALLPQLDSVRLVVTRGGSQADFSIGLHEFLAQADRRATAIRGRANTPCAIVYTSGSTGAPKGALLSQRGMIRSALLTWKYWYGARDDLRTVAQHPINHVGWLVCECVTMLIGGGTIFFRERFNGAATLRLIEKERLNLWIAFPSMVMLAMQSPEFESCDISSLARIALGSLPSVEVLVRLRQRTKAVFSVTYGLTEANGGAVTVTDDDADLESIAGTIGKPLPEIQVRIVDADGRSVQDGSAGEFLIRDSCLFLGYLNKPEATAAALDSEGWLHTGDAVVRDPDGNLRLVGRLKEMFKSGGYNVYPTEIETVIASHPAVSAAAVVEAPDPLWTEIGVAFVILKDGADVGVHELQDYCRSRLANYKVPKRFEIVATMPELPNGKFDKVQLRRYARDLVGVSEVHS
jgi:acyl-CoA synthetase (AMP-forming)/AMP-acid ligase II